MSRWSLLKSALVAKERDCDNSQSIHRFTGYNIVPKRKTLWHGFQLRLPEQEVESVEWFRQRCDEYMALVDTSEILAIISLSDSAQPSPLLDEILALSNVRLDSRNGSGITFYIKHCELTSSLAQCEYWRYLATTLNGQELQLCTREKPRAGGLNVQSLLSNKLHGVDNTGNVCVWPAEPLLLHVLLTVPRFNSMVSGKRVLEIGGGMTALAGLGLAAAGIAASVVVTDGHPDCVKNQLSACTVLTTYARPLSVWYEYQRVCIAMTQQERPQHEQHQRRRSKAALPGSAGPDGLSFSETDTALAADCVGNDDLALPASAFCENAGPSPLSASTDNATHTSTASHSSPIAAQVLHWSPSSNAAHLDALTRGGAELFDVVIASDCLFFRDFHADLLETLRRLLKPGSGVGVFLQPSRDGTMQRFISRCQEGGFFATELQDDYCPQVTNLRREYLARQEELGYAEDVHYPQMLLLRPLY